MRRSRSRPFLFDFDKRKQDGGMKKNAGPTGHGHTHYPYNGQAAQQVVYIASFRAPTHISSPAPPISVPLPEPQPMIYPTFFVSGHEKTFQKNLHADDRRLVLPLQRINLHLQHVLGLAGTVELDVVRVELLSVPTVVRHDESGDRKNVVSSLPRRGGWCHDRLSVKKLNAAE